MKAVRGAEQHFILTAQKELSFNVSRQKG